MTKKEKAVWRESGREYVDGFLNHFRVRQVLKKIKTGEDVAKKLTRKQHFLYEYVGRLSQLESICGRLRQFPLFLSSYNVGLEKQGVSRVSQFIYHIENYLSVVYVFYRRTSRLSGYIKKQADKYRCSRSDIQNLINARESLKASVQPLVDIRGGHVYEKDFPDDEKIREMKKYDKAGDFSTDPSERKEFKSSAKSLLGVQRKRWKKDINNDIAECEVRLGILYAMLDILVWQIYAQIR